jgi:hypothetical protein
MGNSLNENEILISLNKSNGSRMYSDEEKYNTDFIHVVFVFCEGF